MRETDRLRFRPFQKSDGLFLLQLMNQADWIEYIGDKQIRDLKSAEAYIESALMPLYLEPGLGLYVLELKSSNIAAGMCGLLKRDTLDHIDLGFAISSVYQGRGLCFEACQAILSHGFLDLKSPEILAITLPENKPSIQLLLKLGMGLQKRLSLKPNSEELELYQLTQTEYLQSIS